MSRPGKFLKKGGNWGQRLESFKRNICYLTPESGLLNKVKEGAKKINDMPVKKKGKGLL